MNDQNYLGPRHQPSNRRANGAGPLRSFRVCPDRPNCRQTSRRACPGKLLGRRFSRGFRRSQKLVG